jgi:signal transduction histidine kinase
LNDKWHDFTFGGMSRQRHHFAILLMTIGLALLGVFLWLFLKKTWEDEASNLRRETNLLFVSAVRSLESKAFDQLIMRRWGSAPSDTSFDISLRLPALTPRPDSARVVALVREERSITANHIWEQQNRDSSQIKLTFDGLQHLPDASNLSGALSIFITTDSLRQMPTDSLNPQVMNLLAQKFGEAMQRSALPLRWEITRGSSLPDSRVHREMFLAGQYTDLVSGEQLNAEITQYRRYLVGKIWPQLLFSGLLFACVALAFLFIYQSFRQQQRLSDLKNDLIRNMTHELKTPISTVSVAIEALQNFDALADPARTREYLAISRSEINRLTLLVDKVLRMSLFEQGEPALKTELFDFRVLVEEVLAAMKLQFEKYHAEVSFSASGESFSLRGDRLHLASVLYNLLDNALKYSIVRPEIKVGLSTGEGTLLLNVRDQGRGIPWEYQRRIFEKFFRVPTGDVHDVKGYGLGLNYVAAVVRLHRGNIEVQSQVGSGTEFRITLPENRS